jgi:hypothetical protein
MKALGIFLIAFIFYTADFKTFLIGADASINVYLPVSILKYGQLTIHADKFPDFFRWQLFDQSTLRNLDPKEALSFLDTHPDAIEKGILIPSPSTYCLVKTPIPNNSQTPLAWELVLLLCLFLQL